MSGRDVATDSGRGRAGYGEQFNAGNGIIPGFWQLCAAETEANENSSIFIVGGPYHINGGDFYIWDQNSNIQNGYDTVQGQYVCENWTYW